MLPQGAIGVNVASAHSPTKSLAPPGASQLDNMALRAKLGLQALHLTLHLKSFSTCQSTPNDF